MRGFWKKCCLVFCVLTFVAMIPKNTYASAGIQASAAAVSSSKIEVKWSPMEQAGSYAVYRRKASEGAFQKVTVTSSLFYRDASVKPAMNYYYKIVPVSGADGKEMTGAQATTVAKAPGQTAIQKITVKSPTKMLIAWRPAAGSTGYQVLRSDGEGGRYEEIARVNGKSNCAYLDEGVIPGRLHCYKIRPMNQGQKGFGSYSKAVKARTIAKTAVTSITSLSSSQMRITWKKVNNAVKYEVYRSLRKDGGFQKIATVRGSVRKFTDKTVKSGRKYFYRVNVVGSFGGKKITSGYSQSISYRSLKQVRIQSVKQMGDNALKVRWGKVAGATKYQVYRSTSSFGTYQKIATVKGASSLSYTDRKVSSGKTYYYKVQAYSDGKGIVSAGSGTKSESKGSSILYAIMGKSSVTAKQMAAMYKASGKSFPSGVYQGKGAKSIEKFCEIVIDESKKEGVKAEVIFAQVCLETGYLSFGGQVSAAQCNFAGLGATDDGASGATFQNVKTGIRAQVQHLKGYASKDPLNQVCVDPRFIYLSSRRGTAKYVQDLGNGNWATDPNYASKLIRLIQEMKSY